MKKYLIIAATLCAPLLVYAQEYQFLVKPPQFIGNINSSGGLIAYINALFNLAVLIGAVMAVFIIASAGLQYMTTDAITNKKDSLNRIRSALMGLIMLLSIWIFFNQINPEILKLKGFDLPAAQTGGGTPPQITRHQAAQAVMEIRLLADRVGDPT